MATFAGNRLAQTRRLIADSSAWIRQIKAQKAGSYTGAAEVTQYRLAMKTDELAGKLGDLEQQLAGMLQRPDQSLPEPIADKSRELMAALDKEAAPNQLAAVYALHSNQLPRSTERQQLAGTALAKAEKLYDELARLTITELDKLPVQDPIASLLEDPTLDELLAQLEQELPLQELLGIPNRPSNLRIIGDWMRPGNNGGGGGGMHANRREPDEAERQAVAAKVEPGLPEGDRSRTEGNDAEANGKSCQEHEAIRLEQARFAPGRRLAPRPRQGAARAISPGDRAIFRPNQPRRGGAREGKEVAMTRT